MKIIKTLKDLKLLSKVLKWFKVPYMNVVVPILDGIYAIGVAWLNYVISSNQKKSDEIIKKEEQMKETVQTERTVEQPKQNNDTLRDALRNKHRG